MQELLKRKKTVMKDVEVILLMCRTRELLLLTYKAHIHDYGMNINSARVSNYVQQGVTKGDDLTGYKKRTADRGVEKIQEDLLNLQEAYQFLMKKYRYLN